MLTEDKTRLSISGWFYGDPIEKSPVEKQLLEASPPIFVGELPILEWINSSYLNPETQVEIRQKFEADSEVELLGFFNASNLSSIQLYL